MAKKKQDTDVEDLVGKDPNVELTDEDPGGQVRIPGTERAVVKPLVAFMKRHEDTKAEFGAARDKLLAEQSEGLVLYGKYGEYFTESDDAFNYTGGGYTLEIQKGKLKVQTKSLD